MSMKWNGAAVEAAVRAGAFRGVVRGTEAVSEEADTLMVNSPRSGRIYRRRGVEHKASGPGEPPAPDTGRLRQSAQTRYDRAALLGTAAWTTDYARALEMGTRKMAPRPYARPALQNKSEEIRRDVAAEIARALRR